MQTDFLGEAFDRERAVGVDLLVAGFVRLRGGVNQSLSRIEFGHDAVDGIALHALLLHLRFRQEGAHLEMEIAGSTRRNRNMQHRNMPMVPM